MNLLYNLQATFLLLVCATCIQAQSDFTTVINLPENPATPNPSEFSGNSIRDFREISSNTQLNISDGGSVGTFFDAGEPFLLFNGPNSSSTNVEVNVAGGTVGSGFSANSGSTVNISGGTLGSGLVARSGSTVNISGGTVGNFAASVGSTINISAGSFDGFEIGFTPGFFQPQTESIFNISGGTFDGFVRTDTFNNVNVNVSGGTFNDLFIASGGIVDVSDGSFSGSGFVASSESTVNISGGTFADFFQVDSSSTVNISGGTFDANFSAGFNSTVNLFGTAFFLNGSPLENLVLGQATTIFDRGEDIVLSGLLADGTLFDYELNEDIITNSAGEVLSNGSFDSSSTLTFTLVTAVPEPGSGLTLAAISTLLLAQRRRRYARS